MFFPTRYLGLLEENVGDLSAAESEMEKYINDMSNNDLVNLVDAFTI